MYVKFQVYMFRHVITLEKEEINTFSFCDAVSPRSKK